MENDITMPLSRSEEMSHAPVKETLIDAELRDREYWRDIWRFRDLVILLAWRDILVRYKQTAFGVAWAWIRPLVTMLIFVFVFGNLAKLPSSGTPYSLLVFSALLPWQLFSNILATASSSVVDNGNMVSKIYFPRIILPISGSFVSVVDTLVASILLLLLMGWTEAWPNWHVIVLPFFLLLAYGLGVGLGLWIGALNVKYRDFKYVIPFALQIGQYVSPVGFSSAIVPAKWHLLYGLNPMVGIIDGFRWALLGGNIELDPRWLVMSTLMVFILIVTGATFFRRTEHTFADVI